MARSLCRSTATLATLVASIVLPAFAPAQTSEWRPDLVAAYESDGGKNVPNFAFDGPTGTHSAGGVCQMLTSTWLRIAPTVDIDVAKFPVAGAAPEFEQWRACWKLWSVEGYAPWTCCNARLRRALGNETASIGRRATSASSSKEKPAERPKNAAELFYDRLAAPSDVYHAAPIALR